MNIQEFKVKLLFEIENNFESFSQNMTREGVDELYFCCWIDFFICWMEWRTEEECMDAYGDDE